METAFSDGKNTTEFLKGPLDFSQIDVNSTKSFDEQSSNGMSASTSSMECGRNTFPSGSGSETLPEIQTLPSSESFHILIEKNSPTEKNLGILLPEKVENLSMPTFSEEEQRIFREMVEGFEKKGMKGDSLDIMVQQKLLELKRAGSSVRLKRSPTLLDEIDLNSPAGQRVFQEVKVETIGSSDPQWTLGNIAKAIKTANVPHGLRFKSNLSSSQDNRIPFVRVSKNMKRNSLSDEVSQSQLMKGSGGLENSFKCKSYNDAESEFRIKHGVPPIFNIYPQSPNSALPGVPPEADGNISNNVESVALFGNQNALQMTSGAQACPPPYEDLMVSDPAKSEMPPCAIFSFWKELLGGLCDKKK